MNMSNEEEDKMIKEKLSEDKFVFSGQDEYNDNINKEINTSSVRPSKFTHKQKTIFLVVILVIIFTIPIIYFCYSKSNNARNLAVNPKEQQSNIVLKDEIIDDLDENKLKKENTTLKNETKKPVQVDIPQVEKKTTEETTEAEGGQEPEPDPKELADEFEKKLMNEIEIYSLGINRFDGKLDSQEENTILIIMAINSISDNKSEVSSAEASKFITDLTGQTMKEKKPDINQNYLRFIPDVNRFALIKEGNPYIYETSKILTFNIRTNENNKLEIVGTIEKTTKTQIETYEFTAFLTKNEKEPKYFDYRIDSVNYRFIKSDKSDNILIEKV